MNKSADAIRTYDEIQEHRQKIWDALRLIEEGRSITAVERQTGVPRVLLERALVEAKHRQEVIRAHLQTRRDLTSVIRYPERGPWGDSGYFGNCNGYLLIDLIDYFKPASVFDPMQGSGTTGEVCFDLKVDYVGRDLRSGFDLLSSPLPDRQFDLIFWHPPYWPGHQYSDHPNDISNAGRYKNFMEQIREGAIRLKDLLTPRGHLAIMIGDGRKQGVFYPIHCEIIQWNLLPLEAILIKDGQHERKAQYFRYGPTKFIPTLHEYVLIFKRGNP
jgi:hypothetical protein